MDAKDPHRAFWCKSAGPGRVGGGQWCASSERISCNILVCFLYFGCRVVVMTCTDLTRCWALCIRVVLFCCCCFLFRSPSSGRVRLTPLPPALCFPQQREEHSLALRGLWEQGDGNPQGELLCAGGCRVGWFGNFCKQWCFKLALPSRALEWSIWWEKCNQIAK